MITGIHALIFNRDADAVRAFFRDLLQWPAIDAGGGWPIFALPPAELGVHPIDGDGPGNHELYVMCDNIEATVNELTGRGVQFSKPIADEGFGRVAWMHIPGWAELALYEPRHPTAISHSPRV